jgi:hypothetical protein
MRRHCWQQKQDFMQAKRPDDRLGKRQVRARNRIVGPAQYP